MALICSVGLGFAASYRKSQTDELTNFTPIRLVLPQKTARKITEHKVLPSTTAASESTQPTPIDWSKLSKPKMRRAKSFGKLSNPMGIYDKSVGGLSLGNGLIPIARPTAPPAPERLPVVQRPSCSGTLTGFSNPIAWNELIPNQVDVVFEISENGRLSNIKVLYPNPQPPEMVASFVTDHIVRMMSTTRCKPFEIDGKKSVSIGEISININHGKKIHDSKWEETY